MNTPDADGWVTESSEGTPTQPQESHATDADAPVAAAEDGADVLAESGDTDSQATGRDKRGRFSPKSEEAPEAVKAEAAPVEPEKPPSKRSPDGRKLTLRQEIDALTRQKHEEAREVERLRSERQRYASPAPVPSVHGFPSLEVWQLENPGREDPFEDWLTAKAEYIADQRFQKHQAQYEQATRAQTFVERGKSVYADWDDTFASVADIRISPQLGQVLLADPDGHRLAYELAKHPDQHGAVLDAQDALSLGVALGTLKARLSGASPAPSAQSVARSAPPPIQPVGSSPVSQTVSVDDLPFGPEYVRRANEQDKKRGRPW